MVICIQFTLACATEGKNPGSSVEAAPSASPSAAAPSVDDLSVPPAPEASATPTPSPGADNGALPDITAKTYDVTVDKRSSSKRVYLLKDSAGQMPDIGRVLLLRQAEQPVVALLVLKQYPNTQEFAAKAVRRYPGYPDPAVGQSYMAIEKLSDFLSAAPPTAEDKKDLNELENQMPSPSPSASPAPPGNPANAESFDQQLDTGMSAPPQTPSALSEEDQENQEEDIASGLGLDEMGQLDPYRQWLTGTLGFFLNNSTSSTAYYAGGGVRYGYSVAKLIFFKSSKAQDSLAIEGGIFYYKILNLVSQNDAYSIVPVSVTGRYNIFFSEKFAVFGYLGVMQNFVTSVAQASQAAINALNSTVPAIGVGAFVQVGPNWYVRADLGTDTFALGLVLRF